ncbi:MAG: hypothetical protein KGL39_13490 [Patescibacteria group bacterium]|nr:hypothetical protein [Patescibacteria group bacterium]
MTTIAATLLDFIPDGLRKELIRALLDPEGDPSDIELNAFRRRLGLSPEPALTRFPLLVNYGLRFQKEEIGGAYSQVSDVATRICFGDPLGEIKETEVFLLHFGRQIRSGEVISEFEANGLRPAAWQELAAFGNQFPDPALRHQIVALNQRWDTIQDNACYACVISRNGERRFTFGTMLFDSLWDPESRFLALRADRRTIK